MCAIGNKLLNERLRASLLEEAWALKVALGEPWERASFCLPLQALVAPCSGRVWRTLCATNHRIEADQARGDRNGSANESDQAIGISRRIIWEVAEESLIFDDLELGVSRSSENHIHGWILGDSVRQIDPASVKNGLSCVNDKYRQAAGARFG